MAHRLDRLPDGLVADHMLGQALFEGHLGQQRERPRRALLREGAWALVGQFHERLPLCLVEDAVGILRSGLLRRKTRGAAPVEGVYRIAHRLRGASEPVSDLG